MVTARPARWSGYLDEGRGLPDVEAAYRWLAAGGQAPEIEARAGVGRTGGAWIVTGPRDRRSGTVAFELLRPRGSPAATYSLRADVPWLAAPPSVTLSGERTRLELRYTADSLLAPGAYTGVVAGWPGDTSAGAAFRLVTTIVRPAEVADTAVALRRDAPVGPGEVVRSFFRADSARPFHLLVAGGSGQQGLAHLHEPGGAPFREASARPVGSGEQAALFRVDARDVAAGVYEAAAVAPPGGRLTVGVTVRHAPVTLTSRAERDAAVAELVNVSGREAALAVELRLRGGQRDDTVRARGSAIRDLPFDIPAWAVGLEVDIAMSRDQWGRFTDFGVTVLDSAGAQLAQDPLEYAFGRLSTLLPEGHGGTRARLSLYPGFADAGDDREWSVTATIRLYADSAVAVAAETGGEVRLGPEARAAARFRLPPSPWPLPDGFSRLGVILVREADEVWTRESGFPRSGR
jgi:hypothetical protein